RARGVAPSAPPTVVSFLTHTGALLALAVVTAPPMSIRALAVVSVLLLSTSCERLHLPQWGAPATAGGRPVALLAEGSAFDAPARAAAARALEAELGRPVRMLAALPAPADDETKALAARTVGARSLRYD